MRLRLIPALMAVLVAMLLVTAARWEEPPVDPEGTTVWWPRNLHDGYKAARLVRLHSRNFYRLHIDEAKVYQFWRERVPSYTNDNWYHDILHYHVVLSLEAGQHAKREGLRDGSIRANAVSREFDATIIEPGIVPTRITVRRYVPGQYLITIDRLRDRREGLHTDPVAGLRKAKVGQ
jgi:hypothetical protein